MQNIECINIDPALNNPLYYNERLDISELKQKMKAKEYIFKNIP